MKVTKELIEELSAFSRAISKAKFECSGAELLDNAKLISKFVQHVQALDSELKAQNLVPKEVSSPLVEPVAQPAVSPKEKKAK